MTRAVRILGRASSINVRKVLWTCTETATPYEREDWGRGFRPTNSPEYLALNPHALVPVLQDENGSLWESNTICRYLARRAQRDDLLPQDPYASALVERWMDWQAGDLNAAWRCAFLGLVRKNPAFQDPAQIAASTAEWNEKMLVLNGVLGSTGGHVVGPAFTLADIPVGLAVHRWYSAPIERPDAPHVHAYYERLSQRPAFMEHGRNGEP